MNFDLGIRRGDVIESGEEAKNGAGEDMMRCSRHLCDVLQSCYFVICPSFTWIEIVVVEMAMTMQTRGASSRAHVRVIHDR